MGFHYNKNFVPKDKIKAPSGPRDMQRKQQLNSAPPSEGTVNLEILNDLREQVKFLKSRLSEAESQPKVAVEGMFTPEQVDEEINKALASELSDIKLKYELEIQKLKSSNSSLLEENKRLKDDLSNQENKLTTLLSEATTKIESLVVSASQGVPVSVVSSSDRPDMEEVFVDPLDKDATENLENYITVEEEASEKKDLGADVDKLKNLLGKF